MEDHQRITQRQIVDVDFALEGPIDLTQSGVLNIPDGMEVIDLTGTTTAPTPTNQYIQTAAEEKGLARMHLDKTATTDAKLERNIQLKLKDAKKNLAANKKVLQNQKAIRAIMRATSLERGDYPVSTVANKLPATNVTRAAANDYRTIYPQPYYHGGFNGQNITGPLYFSMLPDGVPAPDLTQGEPLPPRPRYKPKYIRK